MAKAMYAGLSFEQVVTKYTKTVGSVCVVRLKNWTDAEDCFQNVFCRLYTKSPEFKDEEHLKAWLIRVSINECKNYLRDNKPLLPLKDAKDTALDFPHDKCDVSWALLQLEPKYRNVLYLYYKERYKIDEIALILNKPVGTIKTLLKRGKEKLRKIYGGDEV
ncbi:MAG: sigma-70 family RNA polymerase sigma factor [Ruminococcus sp.]|nr:sigma-70 family RNA polymerase sigma factor [Ruminococcus sp.]MBQ7133138.1 sigma-70 family RNA polymerase sigma factor [Ruminococcus sp.]